MLALPRSKREFMDACGSLTNSSVPLWQKMFASNFPYLTATLSFQLQTARRSPRWTDWKISEIGFQASAPSFLKRQKLSRCPWAFNHRKPLLFGLIILRPNHDRSWLGNSSSTGTRFRLFPEMQCLYGTVNPTAAMQRPYRYSEKDMIPRKEAGKRSKHCTRKTPGNKS